MHLAKLHLLPGNTASVIIGIELKKVFFMERSITNPSNHQVFFNFNHITSTKNLQDVPMKVINVWHRFIGLTDGYPVVTLHETLS